MKKIITLVALAVTFFSFSKAQTCDTLFNLQSTNDTATLISAITDSAGAGYISGNNAYGDLAIAEAFPVADSGSFLTSATLYFGAAAINSTDSNNIVTIYAWDNLGATVFQTGAPLDAVDSVQVTLAQIALAVTEHKGLLVHFTSASGLSTDTVFVGVVLPVITGDTIALLTNTFNGGADGNGYVLAADPSMDGNYTWNSYNDNYGITGASLGNYIKVTICAAPDANEPYGYFTSTPVSNNNNNYTVIGCTPFNVTVNDGSGPPSPTYEAWIFGDGNTANGLNASDVYTAQGIYYITELVSNDTGSVVEVLVPWYITVEAVGSPVVTVTATPSVDSAADASASVSVISSTGHYFTTWVDSGQAIAFGDTLQGIFNGVYVVSVQDQNGCTVTDSVVVETFGTGIINLNSANQVKVYPNPATDVLNLVWSKSVIAEVSVVDINGKVLSTITTNGDMKTVYDIHSIAAGDYILRITDKTNNQQHSMLFTKLQ